MDLCSSSILSPVMMHYRQSKASLYAVAKCISRSPSRSAIRSEQTVRTMGRVGVRVHPIILGEEVARRHGTRIGIVGVQCRLEIGRTGASETTTGLFGPPRRDEEVGI
jgi:hypothetical protein